MKPSLLLTVFFLIYSNIAMAVEISGYIVRKNHEKVGATVYIDGEKVAVADQNGYFSGEVSAGNYAIYAEWGSPDRTERSVPRAINFSEDTEVRLTVLPLQSVRLIVPASDADQYGSRALRRVRIYEAVTPSTGPLIEDDFQNIPTSMIHGAGAVHANEYLLPEGVYRAYIRAARNTGEEYDVWTGFQVSRTTTDVHLPISDEYFSHPDKTIIIDPSKVEFLDDELDGYLRVRGLAGAASPNMALSILNLQSGHYNWGSSQEDGSFEILINGLAGSEYTLYQRSEIDGWYDYNLGVGTTIRAPADAGLKDFFSTEHSVSNSFTPNSLAESEVLGGMIGAVAQHYGEYDFNKISKGSSGEFEGVVNIVGPSLNDVEVIWNNSGLILEKIVSADGWVVAANPENSSNFMTVSGLPINGEPELNRTNIGYVEYSSITRVGENLWSARFVANFEIPDELSSGRYQIHLDPGIRASVSSTRVFSHNFPHDPSTSVEDGRIGEFEIGDSTLTNIDIALMVNEFSNGSRGATPINREGRFGITPGIITNSHKFIIDDSMPGRKEGASYNLEPYVPLVSWTTKGHQVPLPIKFEFPSGGLEITVTDPAGAVTKIGPAPFEGTYMHKPWIRGGTNGGMGGAAPLEYMKLTTRSEAFDYSFEMYGEYEISVAGNVFDTEGREYRLDGEFAVLKAEALDLEFGVMPGTPFEVDDFFASQVIVQPGVPAEVEVTLSHYPNSDPSKVETTIFSGYANRFGYYDGDQIEYQFGSPGEYRVDVLASHSDVNGVLWAGSRTWGGIVESEGIDLEMRGVKGTEGYPNYRQWFEFDLRPLGPGEMNTHVGPPYRSGDVSWMLAEQFDRSNSAMTAFFTIFDKGEEFVSRVYNRVEGASFGVDLENTGIPFVSTSNLKTAYNSRINPFFDLENSNDHWAYYYNAAERPGVAAREHIGQISTRNNYWRFGDTYNYQLGNGHQGDNPNDFKFIFGGGVYRIPNSNENYYLAYGSLWVHLPFEDEVGGRIMPPFQGASGGPSGGPLLQLFDKDIDIFFHPLGVRPGSVLEVGDHAVFSGQVAPTLPSEVSIAVTTPSGDIHIVAGEANKVGYFYQPDAAFVIEEPGVYSVDISVTHKGLTSSGAVEPPFPVGGILSSDVHNFQFYAVSKSSSEAALSESLPSKLPISTQLNFAFESAEVNRTQSLYSTATMPGFVLSQGKSSSLEYSYNAKDLHQDFPNLDVVEGNSPPWDNADTITYSFLVETKNQQGEALYNAQQFTLQGEELVSAVRLPAITGSLAITMEERDIAAGEILNANLNIDSRGVVDLYVALKLPSGDYITLGESEISEVGVVTKFRQAMDLSTQSTLPIVDIVVPPGVPSGEYSFFAIAVPKDSDIFDAKNWVLSDSLTWELNSSR